MRIALSCQKNGFSRLAVINKIFHWVKNCFLFGQCVPFHPGNLIVWRAVTTRGETALIGDRCKPQLSIANCKRPFKQHRADSGERIVGQSDIETALPQFYRDGILPACFLIFETMAIGIRDRAGERSRQQIESPIPEGNNLAPTFCKTCPTPQSTICHTSLFFEGTRSRRASRFRGLASRSAIFLHQGLHPWHSRWEELLRRLSSL